MPAFNERVCLPPVATWSCGAEPPPKGRSEQIGTQREGHLDYSDQVARTHRNRPPGGVGQSASLAQLLRGSQTWPRATSSQSDLLRQRRGRDVKAEEATEIGLPSHSGHRSSPQEWQFPWTHVAVGRPERGGAVLPGGDFARKAVLTCNQRRRQVFRLIDRGPKLHGKCGLLNPVDPSCYSRLKWRGR